MLIKSGILSSTVTQLNIFDNAAGSGCVASCLYSNPIMQKRNFSLVNGEISQTLVDAIRKKAADGNWKDCSADIIDGLVISDAISGSIYAQIVSLKQKGYKV